MEENYKKPISLLITTLVTFGTVSCGGEVNRDRKFDENDILSGKELYCITSPISFSCVNLVPCIFRQSGQVTLIGRTTGGGSCAVGFASTAWGSSFRMSSFFLEEWFII